MNHKIFSFLFLAIIGVSSLEALKNEPLFPLKKTEEPKIYINNRILARINGKPITTYDLMKKMDMSFFRQYPEYSSSVEARAQYYDMSWKYVLEDMIDKQLILADSKESKITISSGDVRQEIEATFGPNIIENLDKMGMTYDEASKMMEEEITMRKMVGGRVHSKAVGQVTPAKIRFAYQQFVENPENGRLAQWSYQIVTVKDRTLPKTEETAKIAYQLLLDGTSLDQLAAKLKEQKALGRKASVTVSKPIKHHDKELSKEYQQILATLDPGTYSQPFSHKSRANQSIVYRILFLQEKIAGGIPSFKEMEAKLKDQLLDQVIEQETSLYLQKLRQHYHILAKEIADNLPSDYQPFVLK